MKTRLLKKLRREAEKRICVVETLSGRYQVQILGRPFRSCSTFEEAVQECDFWRKHSIHLEVARRRAIKRKQLTPIY